MIEKDIKETLCGGEKVYRSWPYFFESRSSGAAEEDGVFSSASKSTASGLDPNAGSADVLLDAGPLDKRISNAFNANALLRKLILACFPLCTILPSSFSFCTGRSRDRCNIADFQIMVCAWARFTAVQFDKCAVNHI